MLLFSFALSWLSALLGLVAPNAETAQAAFFPSLSLSAIGGVQTSVLGDLLTLPARYWALGPALVSQAMANFRPTVVVHLAARAGVRPSLDHPQLCPSARFSTHANRTAALASCS